MSSAYFSRHRDTIHCGQQWLLTGPEGEEVTKGPRSECRSSLSSSTLHAHTEKTHPLTHSLRPGWRRSGVAEDDKLRRVGGADRSPQEGRSQLSLQPSPSTAPGSTLSTASQCPPTAQSGPQRDATVAPCRLSRLCHFRALRLTIRDGHRILNFLIIVFIIKIDFNY